MNRRHSTRGRRWTHSFRGRRYEIVVAGSREIPSDRDGDCDPPTKKNKRIRIYKNVPPKKALEVTVHEALHACYWDLDEKAVDQAARDLSHFLWRMGYRKVHE